MVRKGGLYINFERVKSTDELFCRDQHILAGDTSVIRIGNVGLSCALRKLFYILKCLS